MAEKRYENHPFRERFKHLLSTAYEMRGLTSVKIAQDIGVCWSTMCYYKSGRTLPTAENLIKIADYFGISTDYLLGREGYELEENK
jgi:transcriptional regulator with XRE-family HTH domain